MPPPEDDLRRPSVDLEHLPGKGGHHALERLVRRVEGAVCGTIVLVGGDQDVVGASLDGFGTLGRRAAVDGQRVLASVDGAPVFDVRLV